MTADQQNSGPETYSTFIPFTPRNVEQQISVYMLNGLLLLTHVDMKVSSQAQYPVNN